MIYFFIYYFGSLQSSFYFFCCSLLFLKFVFRDRDLIQRIGVATAMEVRATGIHCTFAPCVAVSGFTCNVCSFSFLFCLCLLHF